jgi:hypothetical protein
MDRNGRLDIILDLHNPEPHHYPSLMAHFMELDKSRADNATAINSAVSQAAGGPVRNLPPTLWMTNRLGGWLGYYYGGLPVLYEINSQCPAKLPLEKTRDLGTTLVRGAVIYLQGSTGRAFLDPITEFRVYRKKAVDASKEFSTFQSLFESEERTRRLAVNLRAYAVKEK